MSTFKQKSLFAALAGLGVLGVVDSAQAVHMNMDGLGQALVYPYYTARSSANNNAYVTALSVVNTTASAKAVKVRFLEGKNSKEVLDFNLFLSQYDVWTAGIVAAGAGAGVFTADNSCTTPAVSKNPANPTRFRNGAYAGDGGGDTLDRTYEGYFEILEMGAIVGGSSLETSVTHSSDFSGFNTSKPACTGLPVTDAFPSAITSPSGGLMGAASLINVNEGTDYSYDAIALDGWSVAPQWSGPGTVTPTIASAAPFISVVIDNTSSGGRAVRTTWNNGRDAVTATMMRSHVYNEYTVEAGIKSATDWVVTMPTKRFYVSSGTGNASPPFQSNFRSTGSCDNISLTYYDREEQSPGAIIDFSPTTPESRSLCWEANVLTFSTGGATPAVSNVLHSTNYASVALGATWQNGWADLSFPLSSGYTGSHSLAAPNASTVIIDINSGVVTSGTNQTYFGLPVVGFAVQSFTNGALAGATGPVLSNYGGNFNHKYLRDIRSGIVAQ
ncbi:MAG: hypothetical protein ABI831_01895 [Betaproteobacteria bacterium]